MVVEKETVAAFTVMLSGAVIVTLAESTARTVKENVPIVMGVPEIIPVGVSVKPFGNVPDCKPKDTLPVLPAVARFCE